MRRLRTRSICGVKVRILVGSIAEVPALAGASPEEPLDGYFDCACTTIFVREGQSPSQEANTVMHEQVHAFLYLSGLGHLLASATDLKGQAYEDFEEVLVQLATPHLVGLTKC